jgi:hypothetical protein
MPRRTLYLRGPIGGCGGREEVRSIRVGTLEGGKSWAGKVSEELRAESYRSGL